MDAHDAQEQAMGWHYNLEDQSHFPFRAKCIAEREISPLRKGQEADVVGLAPAEECEREIFVALTWEQRTLAVPWAPLQALKADKPTRQAIDDWHYWVKQGYEF